jgi:hypothetical protein
VSEAFCGRSVGIHITVEDRLESALRRAPLRDRYVTVSQQAGLKASAYED